MSTATRSRRKPWVPPRLEMVEIESVWLGHNANPGDADSPTANAIDNNMGPASCS